MAYPPSSGLTNSHRCSLVYRSIEPFGWPLRPIHRFIHLHSGDSPPRRHATRIVIHLEPVPPTYRAAAMADINATLMADPPDAPVDGPVVEVSEDTCRLWILEPLRDVVSILESPCEHICLYQYPVLYIRCVTRKPRHPSIFAAVRSPGFPGSCEDIGVAYRTYNR